MPRFIRFPTRLLLLALVMLGGGFVSGCTTPPTEKTPSSHDPLRQWHTETPDGIPVIRVLLKEIQGQRNIRVSSSGPFRVELLGRDDVARRFPANRTVTFVRQGPHVYVNGRRFPGGNGYAVIPAEQGTLLIGNQTYRGNLRIHRNQSSRGTPGQNGLQAVNHVPVNKYLWSVIGAEILPDWTGDAINRTQAVAARTYAIAELNRRSERAPGGRFDVYNTQQSQVYRGVATERPATRRGVEATKGQVLFYGDRKLVPAFFSSTCGGHTSRPRPGFSWLTGPPPPPLQGVACPWDNVSPHHRWTARIPARVLLRALFSGTGSSRVRDVTVQSRRDDGRARKLAFRLSGGTTAYRSGAEVRRAIADLRSELENEARRDRWWIRSTKFNVKKQSDHVFRFRGAGWGHGVGLCQYGAYGASVKGLPHEQILTHYYPTARLDRLYPTD